jgi:type I restriction enzyme, S subunit
MSEASFGIEDSELSDGETPSAYPPSIQAGIPKLGVTPKGWTRFRLGDLLRKVERPAKLVDGKSYQLVTAKRSRGGIVARETLRGDQIRTKTQFYVESGDFLMSNRQISHGACGIVPASLHRAVVSNEYTTFHTADALDPGFLNALSHSVYFQQTCFHSSVGVHVEKLVFRLENWLDWEFDIPPLPEQRRIVAVLDAWDQAIDQIERLIAAQKTRQSRIAKLLFENSSLKDPSRNDWRPFAIGEIAECFAGGTPDRGGRNLYGGDIPWVKSAEVASSHISGTGERLTEAGVAASSAKWVPKGSTLIAMYGANAGQVGRLAIDATTNQAVLAIVPNKMIIDPEYLYYSVSSVIPSLMRKVQGSGQPNLNASIVKEERIPVPEMDRQVIVAKTAGSLQAALNNLIIQLDRRRDQKRGLMQKLLTGEWRLDDRFDSRRVAPRAALVGDTA